MSEWLKEHDWKSCIGRTLYRGFKSHALRHKRKDDHNGDRLFLCLFFKGSAAVADEAQQHGLDGKPVVILFPFVVLVDGKGPAD